jgi:hypothetical protein
MIELLGLSILRFPFESLKYSIFTPIHDPTLAPADTSDRAKTTRPEAPFATRYTFIEINRNRSASPGLPFPCSRTLSALTASHETGTQSPVRSEYDGRLNPKVGSRHLLLLRRPGCLTRGPWFCVPVSRPVCRFGMRERPLTFIMVERCLSFVYSFFIFGSSFFKVHLKPLLLQNTNLGESECYGL